MRTFEVCFCPDGSRVIVKAETVEWGNDLRFKVGDKVVAIFFAPQWFIETSAGQAA